MHMILSALKEEPVFVDELPLPYGDVKHPDHEYVEQLLRSIGYIHNFGYDEDEMNTLQTTNSSRGELVATYAKFGSDDEKDAFYLRYKKTKNDDPEFFLIPAGFGGELPVGRIKSIDEESGDIIRDDDSVYFRAKLLEPTIIQTLNLLEHNGFRLMRGSDPTWGYLFMKGNEVVGIARSMLSDVPFAERVLVTEVDGELSLESKGITDLGSLLRSWHTRNFKPPRVEPTV